MEKYEYLEHTADLKFRAYGKTLEEAFTNSVLAMFNFLVDVGSVKSEKSKSINVSGADLKSLLYNFLEEFLFLMDTEGFMLGKVQSIQIRNINGRYMLSCLVNGDSAENYEVGGDIKAITYNEMEIGQENGRFMIQVVCDI